MFGYRGCFRNPGENHITSQMKDSLEISKQRGWSGNMIQEWISRIVCLKRNKNETTKNEN